MFAQFSILHSPFSILNSTSRVYPGLHPGLVCGAPLGRWLQSRLFATLRICPHPHSPRSSITCQAPQGCTSCFSLLHAVLIRTLLFLHISDCAQSCYLLNSSLFRNTDEKCGLHLSRSEERSFLNWKGPALQTTAIGADSRRKVSVKKGEWTGRRSPLRGRKRGLLSHLDNSRASPYPESGSRATFGSDVGGLLTRLASQSSSR